MFNLFLVMFLRAAQKPDPFSTTVGYRSTCGAICEGLWVAS